jgi:predicted RNase H-like HicB family nuclease
MDELVFEVAQEPDGGFVAEALGESIVTQADTWEELRANVREAVKAFYFDRPARLSYSSIEKLPFVCFGGSRIGCFIGRRLP